MAAGTAVDAREVRLDLPPPKPGATANFAEAWWRALRVYSTAAKVFASYRFTR